ncbi:MAG TPA: tetraacyldisaccharide 4'-kinase [Gemmatimonadales bacterium]|nr:tetraacyldisaccharide 4'-kinase [Gemmatimonadales bacterium]
MRVHRLAHWVWWSGAAPARAARGVLLPFAFVYRTVMSARAKVYARGWLRRRHLPLPSVAIGNLAVGGAGKTPLAAWVAAFFAERGAKPGILLRGYRGDEQAVHQRLVPDAIVVADADRLAGAQKARAAGARVLVLDDAYQRLNVGRDVNIAVVSTESSPPRHVAWPLPAGPWREDWSALGRADIIVVTRRRAAVAEARALAGRIAARWPNAVVASLQLEIDGLTGLRSGQRVDLSSLARKRVRVVAGIADPVSFAAQVRAVGASVQLTAYQDHHPYSRSDIARLAQAAHDADYVVVTEKDAVKLRSRWPHDAPEPLVAQLATRWELNGEAVEGILEGVLTKVV